MISADTSGACIDSSSSYNKIGIRKPITVYHILTLGSIFVNFNKEANNRLKDRIVEAKVLTTLSAAIIMLSDTILFEVRIWLLITEEGRKL